MSANPHPSKSQSTYDVVVIGAGAAGMMCASVAGARGRRVLLLDHASKIGEKIRISGGGRCNFTNIHTKPESFLSHNPHFCKSALSQYTPQDFIALVNAHGIRWHEKKLGQLFCDESAQQIIDMLLNECKKGGVTLRKNTAVRNVQKKDNGDRDSGYVLIIETAHEPPAVIECQSLVIATGGLSIPKIGASKFGYDLARQFSIPLIETRPALVPLTFSDATLERCKNLSGVSVEASVTAQNKTAKHFAEGLLFTHRGLSGPSILQISSYWHEGEAIAVNLTDGLDVPAFLQQQKSDHPKRDIHTALNDILPKRLADDILQRLGISGKIAELPQKTLNALADSISHWTVKPNGTEGYRTAEVTLGGVDTAALSSKTMEARAHKGLYFIGEVVDVTGHLGGFNFQWAWSSGYVAGMNA
ncbi:MAG: NAD(P)/FAD-dependent oxidoreductase [Alphaproteobacteria bacterium]